MPASSITSLTTAIGVDQVESIVVTASASDGNGGFIRAIRIYGAPNGTNAPPVFTLTLTSSDASKIAVHTGDLTF
jgi:hypothetical protein